MQVVPHTVNKAEIAEVSSDIPVIQSLDDALDLIGNLGYQGFQAVILRKEQLDPAFFDLKTGLAGEVLQKFSTYQLRLLIVGDFSVYESKSLKDFIFESNKSRHVNFVGSVAEALAKFS